MEEHTKTPHREANMGHSIHQLIGFLQQIAWGRVWGAVIDQKNLREPQATYGSSLNPDSN